MGQGSAGPEGRGGRVGSGDEMRAFEAKVSGREAVEVMSFSGCWGGCGGFAAREEVPANGFNGEDEDAKGFAEAEDDAPVENGLLEDEADDGFTPNSEAPMFDCCFCAGSSGTEISSSTC